MHQCQDSMSRRLGPVFAEVAAQAANAKQGPNKAWLFFIIRLPAAAQQGPKSGQQGVENPNPMPAPSRAYKPAHGGYPSAGARA